MDRNDKPASANAAGSRIAAHGGQAARAEDPRRIVTRRVSWAGHPYDVRFGLDDPHWRRRALAALDPESAAAYAVRAAPLTAAERTEFAVWAARELHRIEGTEL